MAFTIRNMFSSGDAPEGGATVSAGAGPGGGLPPSGFSNSPFAMAGAPQGGNLPESPMNMGGFGSPGVPAFKPISEEAFRTGALETRPSGGASPFLSMGDHTPALVVADILPALPPDVARGNGAPMDQAVHLSPAVIDAARSDGSHSVALFEIFRVCPALFQVPVSPADPRKVRIPKLAPGFSAMPSPPAAAPSPSPFAMAQQGGAPAPSPFAAMQSPPPAMGMMPPPEQSAPTSRPIGTLPPRRPDGVPPSIPTQNDFTAAPTLQLPGSPVPGPRDVAPPPGDSPFAMAFSAPPAASAPSNFISPPKPEVPEMQGFGMPQQGASPFAPAAPAPAFGASPFAEVPPAPAPSPFLSQPPAGPTAGGPKSVPLGGMFASSPSPSSPPPGMPSPFGSAPVSPAGNAGGPMFGPGGSSPFGSPAPASFLPSEPPPARPASRPLVPGPTSRPLAGPVGAFVPPAAPPMPPGVGETVEMPLSSIVKGNNPQDLGFDPNFIPAWIMTKLPAYLVKQQAGAAEILVELGAVIDGTDESFRPIISHGKRDFKVKLPHNEVFHALPPVGAGPSSMPVTPAFQPPAQPAPPAAAPIQPVQPVGLQGLTSAFALGSSGSAFNRAPETPPPPAPASRPLFSAASPSPSVPASTGWQSAGVPSPLFSAAPPTPAPVPEFTPPPAMSLPVPPMPEIAPPPAAPASPSPFMSGGFAAPAAEPAFSPAAAFAPALPPVAPPVPMGVSTVGGDRGQVMLRALLGIAGPVSREMVVETVSRLPGVEACVFVLGQQSLQSGAASAAAGDFIRQGVELSRSLKTLASAIGIGEAETLSVNSDSRLVTFSFHESAALGILHADRESASGLREKVSLLCKELAAMSPA